MLRRAFSARVLRHLAPTRGAAPPPAAASASRVIGRLRAQSTLAPAAASAAVGAPPSPSPSPDAALPEWAGGDVEAVVHDSLSCMAPVDVMTLSGRLFNAPVRTDLVHRTVVWQLACRRQGTAKTKTRAEVSGSGRKYRPQKGTGRSRQGARTSPIFRGGGRAHGAKPRDYSFPLPRNVRRAALRAVLSDKRRCGQLWIVDDIAVPGAKTRAVLDAFRRLSWRSALVVDHKPGEEAGVDASFRRASHVVQPVLAMNVRGLNVYDALSFDMLVLTRAALREIEARYAGYDQFV